MRRWRVVLLRSCMLALLALLLAGRAAAADVTVDATVESNDVVINEAVHLHDHGQRGAERVAAGAVRSRRVRGQLPRPLDAGLVRQRPHVGQHQPPLPRRAVARRRVPVRTVRGRRRRASATRRSRSRSGSPPRQRAARPASRPAERRGCGWSSNRRKTEVYVGERVDLALTLYIGNVRIRDLQYPGHRRRRRDARQVLATRARAAACSTASATTRCVLRTTMTPVRPGTRRPQRQHGDERGHRPPRHGSACSTQFFPAEAKPVEVRADAAQLTVLPLPEQGKPADFTGAVGTFDFTLTAKPTELDAGDPITLRMEITGERQPRQRQRRRPCPVDDRFRVYDAQPVKGEDSGERRVFEQVVIPEGRRRPRAAGGAVHLLRSRCARLSHHHPGTDGAHACAPGARPSRRSSTPTSPPPSSTQPKAQPLGRDIVYIKDAPGAVAGARTASLPAPLVPARYSCCRWRCSRRSGRTRGGAIAWRPTRAWCAFARPGARRGARWRRWADGRPMRASTTSCPPPWRRI